MASKAPGAFVLERELVESVVRPTDEPDSVMNGRLLPTFLEFARSKKPGSTIEPSDEVGLLRYAASLDAWELTHAIVRFAEESGLSHRRCLWDLGDGLIRKGWYALAASLFHRGAWVEWEDPLASAAFLAKAAWAGNNSWLAPRVEQWIVFALDRLRAVGSGESRAHRVVKFLAYYTASRSAVFRDAHEKAESFRAQAIVETLREADLRALGIECNCCDIPDILLLGARIARGRIEALGDHRTEDVQSLLTRAANSSQETSIVDVAFSHRLALQRAAFYRLTQDYVEARRQVDVGFYTLGGTTLESASTSDTEALRPLNLRRVGYLFCAAAEIELACGQDPGSAARSIRFSEKAGGAWSEPYYPRGLCRAKRLHATALIRTGRQFSEASRLLTEAISLARTASLPAEEIRALAAKSALHGMMGHDEKRNTYLTRLQQVLSTHPEIPGVIEALQRGEPRPRPISANKHALLKRKAVECGLWGDHPVFLDCLNRALSAAQAGGPVLITGESGTGKELIATFIHKNGPRSHRNMIAVNAATLGDLMTELFGHEKGAYTDAGETTPGLLEDAHQSTLFLDEVGELGKKLQAALLRVVEQQEVRRVGGRDTRKVDVALILATNAPLEELSGYGDFRSDFLFRINLHRVAVPPLRDRGHDVVIIGDRIVRALQVPVRKVAGLSIEAWDLIARRRWPGNVRELKYFLRAMLSALDSEEEASAWLTEDSYVTAEFVQRELARHESFVDHQSRPIHGRDIDASDRPGADVERPKNEAVEGPEGDVLHVKIPLSTSALEALLGNKHFRSRRDLCRHLKREHPGYPGNPDSILRLMTPDRRPAFARVLDRAFGCVTGTGEIGRD